MPQISFHDMAIVSCGTVSLELNYLKQEGFLDTEQIKEVLDHTVFEQIIRSVKNVQAREEKA